MIKGGIPKVNVAQWNVYTIPLKPYSNPLSLGIKHRGVLFETVSLSMSLKLQVIKKIF
jgi:hypothetical protein